MLSYAKLPASGKAQGARGGEPARVTVSCTEFPLAGGGAEGLRFPYLAAVCWKNPAFHFRRSSRPLQVVRGRRLLSRIRSAARASRRGRPKPQEPRAASLLRSPPPLRATPGGAASAWPLQTLASRSHIPRRLGSKAARQRRFARALLRGFIQRADN